MQVSKKDIRLFPVMSRLVERFLQHCRCKPSRQLEDRFCDVVQPWKRITWYQEEPPRLHVLLQQCFDNLLEQRGFVRSRRALQHGDWCQSSLHSAQYWFED